MMVGSWVSLIRESKHSLRSPPPCQAGKCTARQYVLVQASKEQAIFRCRCGDLYISEGNSFLPRSCQIIPYVHTWSGTRQTLGSLYRAFDTNASRANLTSLPSHFDWA